MFKYCDCDWKADGCPGDRALRFCRRYRALYSREWRKSHPLSEDARRRDIARSYAGVYKRRGEIEIKPCAVCGGEEKLEMHHVDYEKPLVVTWLCRACHVKETMRGA